jgi:uncharacterized protein YceK
MTEHMRLLCAVITSMLLISGCATLSETFEERSHCGNSRIYCGTRVDAIMIAMATDEGAGVLRAFWPIALIDLPFSIVADTLLLPYTMYKGSEVKD